MPIELQFRAAFDGKPEESIDVNLYAFDRQGELIAAAPVKEGAATLALDEARLKGARIFLAPALPEEKKTEPTLELMEKLHAYEPTWKFNGQQRQIELLPIPELLWKWWHWCWCRVRGRVVRPVTINGNIGDRPICHARVHICEVDRWPIILLKLPDPLVIRLRDELLAAIQRPHPIPEPDPPPFIFDPGVIDPSPENIARLNRAAIPTPQVPIPGAPDMIMLNPQPEPPGIAPLQRARLQVAAMSEMTPVTPKLESIVSTTLLTDLPVATRAALLSPSVAIVRQALIDNVALLRPWFCWWPWLWPYFYHCDELAVLMTDEQGRFDTTILYLCNGDQPDLYFWVEYFIDGAWTTVYNPGIPCHTYWDYACGSEVTVRVSDPRVPWCEEIPDLPGLQVAVLAIGNEVSVHEIQGAGAGVAQGLTNDGWAFGGVLEPHVYFSRSALFAHGITHYRWSYRRLTLSDGSTPVSDSPHTMSRRVVRHYSVIDPTPPDFPLSFPVDVMGPDPAFPGHDLFRIQPIDPPTPGIEWVPSIDAREDSATAFFETHLLEHGNAEAAAGKYELTLELFKADGTRVDLSDIDGAGTAILLKVATADAPFGSSTVPTGLAPEENLLRNGAGHVVAFRMVVRVDNNVCQSQLFPISGPGLTVDADCGFIQYASGASATLSFRAFHPHDFAALSFDVIRGAGTPIPDANASGRVDAGMVALNGYARSAGSIFSKSVDVSTLLTVNTPAGHTPCDRAAFSEMLIVTALVTDGWRQLSELNPVPNPIHAAFALEPV